jgi:hypothetical protein
VETPGGRLTPARRAQLGKLSRTLLKKLHQHKTALGEHDGLLLTQKYLYLRRLLMPGQRSPASAVDGHRGVVERDALNRTMMHGRAAGRARDMAALPGLHPQPASLLDLANAECAEGAAELVWESPDQDGTMGWEARRLLRTLQTSAESGEQSAAAAATAAAGSRRRSARLSTREPAASSQSFRRAVRVQATAYCLHAGRR